MFEKVSNIKTDLIHIASTFSSVSYITFTGKLFQFISIRENESIYTKCHSCKDGEFNGKCIIILL